MLTGPLTSAEVADIRRFAGYPVSGAVLVQLLAVQGDSVALDTVVASLNADQIAALRTVYLTNLYTLEQAIPTTGGGLDVAKAAVYERNPLELQERETLFVSWRQKLCYFLGVNPGAGIFASGTASLVPAAFIV